MSVSYWSEAAHERLYPRFLIITVYLLLCVCVCVSVSYWSAAARERQPTFRVLISVMGKGGRRRMTIMKCLFLHFKICDLHPDSVPPFSRVCRNHLSGVGGADITECFDIS